MIPSMIKPIQMARQEEQTHVVLVTNRTKSLGKSKSWMPELKRFLAELRKASKPHEMLKTEARALVVPSFVSFPETKMVSYHLLFSHPPSLSFSLPPSLRSYCQVFVTTKREATPTMIEFTLQVEMTGSYWSTDGYVAHC